MYRTNRSISSMRNRLRYWTLNISPSLIGVPVSSNSMNKQGRRETAVSEVDGAKRQRATSLSLSVFLLIRSLALGGAQRQLVELAVGLLQRGHQVTVATFYSGGPLERDLDQAGVVVVDLQKAGRWDTVGFLLRLRGAIRHARPDVLYSLVGGANIFAAAVWPIVFDAKLVWSILSSDVDLTQYDWVHRFGYLVECRLAPFPNLIISNSEAGLEFAAQRGFP